MLRITVLTDLLRLSFDDHLVPPVVVKSDGGRAYAGVQPPRPQIDREGYSTVRKSQVEVVFNTVSRVEEQTIGAVSLFERIQP